MAFVLMLSSHFPANAAPAVDTPEGVVAICRKVGDWQLANPNTTPEHGPTEWTQGTLYTGIMALYQMTGDPKYLDAMLEMGRGNEWKLGPRTYFADDHTVGQTYCELYEITNDPAMITPMREQFDSIMANPNTRNLEWPAEGAPKEVWEEAPWSHRWSWCDALFMAPPAWARLAKITGDPRYLEFMEREWWATTDHLYDKDAHLFYRDSRFFTQKTPNGKKMFWARGNGWVIAGLARVLDELPMSYPSRPRYEELFRNMAGALAESQQPDGLWHPSLADPEHFAFGETSGSAFFCFALAWGVNHGILDAADYRPRVVKAWSALCAKVKPDGMLGGVQRIGGAPDKVTDNDTEVYGVGAFLLAGKQMLTLFGGAENSAHAIDKSTIQKLRAVVVRDWIASPSLHHKQNATPETHPGENLDKILATMSPDGSWPDVDYISTPRSNWPSLQHFEYLHDLAVAFNAEEQSQPKEQLKTAILRGLDYWLVKDFQNPNWWYQSIGLPAYFLGPLLLMFQEDLNSAQLVKGKAILSRCDLKYKSRWRSGGNLIYDCRAALHYGLLAGDGELLGRLYSKMIHSEFKQTPPEGSGIKEDWSEWEHGNLLFNHGYGSLLVEEAARLLSYARQADIPVRQETVDFMTAFLLNGSQWMARGAFLDYSAVGREIARTESLKPGPNYLSVGASYLADLNPGKKGELEGLVRRVAGEEPALEGNRLFHVSDFMSHSRTGFYASVRMYSTRTINTEICNGENRLGHHLGVGAMWVIANGDEYRGVFPVWDWRNIPGTTVNKTSLDDAGIDEVDSGWFPSTDPEEEGFGRARLRVSRKGRTDFVGGVSDGRIGVACFDMKVLGLNARKSWFFLDDGIVCLGAGISDSQPGGVMTTVNQCRKTTPVKVLDQNGRIKELKPGTQTLRGTRVIQHGRFSYLFPEETAGVVCSNQIAKGNWHRINVNHSDAMVEEELFSLVIEHGEKPQDATYAYRILAETDMDKAKAALESGEVQILSNTKWLQAIHDRRHDIVAAVFYRPGILNEGKLDLRVSEPCAILLEPSSGKLFVSDPKQNKKTINIEINGEMYFVRVDSGKTTIVKLRPDNTIIGQRDSTVLK